MPQTLNLSQYSFFRGVFQNFKYGANIYSTIYVILKYTKNNPAITTLKITLSFFGNTLTKLVDVSAQSINTTMLYIVNMGKPTNTNFPLSSKLTSPIVGVLTSTPTQFSGPGTGYFKYVKTDNTDTLNIRSFNLGIDTDTYSITLLKSGFAGNSAVIILWQTPTTSYITESDPANSGKIQAGFDILAITGVNSNPLTIAVQELDGNNEVFSQNSISSTFYWIYVE
jgi:hypothetical protein